MKKRIHNQLEQSYNLQSKILKDSSIINKIYDAADMMINCLNQNGRIYICGNGGSAAESIHLASELMGRFKVERNAFPAISLNSDIAIITSIANDYGYNYVFRRQISGVINSKDILFVLSTSGNSENLYQGVLEANKLGAKTIALLGKKENMLQNLVSIPINITSKSTARIQESHLLIIHILCDLIDFSVMQKQ